MVSVHRCAPTGVIRRIYSTDSKKWNVSINVQLDN